MAIVALLVLALASTASASCCSGMVMNSLGLQLTENSEGYVDHVYNDAAGNPTVCYGHLVTAGETFPPVVSQAECSQLLQQDLGSAESCVQRSVNVNLNSNQFSALVDFTFNLGCGSLQSSTLLRILNQGNYAGVPAQMMRWTYAGGRQLPGLVTRRQNEGTLWNTPVSGGATTQAPTQAPTQPASTQPPTQATTQGTSAAAAAGSTSAPAAGSTSAAAAGTSGAGAATSAAGAGTTSASGSSMAAEAVLGSTSTSSRAPFNGVALLAVGAAMLVLAVAAVAVVKIRARKQQQQTEQTERLLASTETI